MSDSEYIGVKEVVSQPPAPPNPQIRVVAVSPSSEASSSPAWDPAEEYLQRVSYVTTAAPPSAAPPRKLPPPPSQPRTGMERAAGILRMALPFVQRMLPLLDGNIDLNASNAHAPQPPPKAPPQPQVNIVPLQEGLADLRVQQRALRDQVVEQNTSLKRVEDQLQAVREATDRNTLEQQELLGDLKSVGNKVNVFAFIAMALLGVSVILNVVLYLQIRHIIP
jgi:hypothetical protein